MRTKKNRDFLGRPGIGLQFYGRVLLVLQKGRLVFFTASVCPRLDKHHRFPAAAV